MTKCPACQESLPDEAQFCGVCGFRLAPMPKAPKKSKRGRKTRPPKAQQPKTPEKAVPKVTRPKTAPELPAVAGKTPSTEIPEYRGGQPERRLDRFALCVEVGYGSEHNFYAGFSQNISEGGLFIATHHLLPLGSTIDVSFSIPGLPVPYDARCEVRWIRELGAGGSDTPPGMGVRFLDLDTEAADAIDLFISHREPIFYED